MSEMDLTLLVNMAKNGDRNAFGQLVSQFEPVVFGIAMKRLRNVADAEDIVQETFVMAMQKLHQLREPAAFPGWLRQIASNLAANRLARSVHAGSLTGAEMESNDMSPLSSILAGEETVELQAAIGRLKPIDRDVLLAFYVRDLSIDEIAREFEVPLGTVKRRLHTARNRLRQLLTDPFD